MNRITSCFDGMPLLPIFMCAMIIAMAFHAPGSQANDACDAWVDYFVDEDGNGTCTIGIGPQGDFLNGTGVARCSFARNGNINCTCHGEHELLLENALIFNDSDQCCITVGQDTPYLSDNTFGLGTPGGIANATCKVKQ